ncbi:MAG: dTDP-4-dehydrorhamnose reductase [Pseudoramibacter sp. EUB1.1]|uniref:dTDP-4-dehydrorhamnose reductase n=1 Tax=Candidatus Pseudoramibacter fermentans TaxID=2594427 RepID=A0A6L5GU68_9FIRM|nr:dTDP-4-dehydrorhamnose reductase [Candidatus Pseudoramibacter fermentans]RRG07098.1 MAG: dTDP-4-dehydrorhamnose reductase [Lactobacillus sp.]
MTKILITGANGQLGTELRNLLDERGVAYDAFDAKYMDITDQQAVDAKFDALKPAVVYHCAAYTAVDKAEDEGKQVNWRVNEDGTRNVAAAAKRVGAKLVYISTDYVFDGTNSDEYQVDDPTNPKNEYGKAKLAGERAVKEKTDDYYIIRTSWVFGKYGKNFVYTMLRLAKDHDKLTVVDDQFGRPTWTRTLAEFMTYLVDHEEPFGTYQLSNENSCSWYEFAKEILKDQDVEVAPVPSEAYSQKAYRPRHSIMSLSKAEETGFEIISWQEALAKFLTVIGE